MPQLIKGQSVLDMESEAGNSPTKTQRKHGSFLSSVTLFRPTFSYNSTFSQAFWGTLLPCGTQKKEFSLTLLQKSNEFFLVKIRHIRQNSFLHPEWHTRAERPVIARAQS